MQEKLRKYQNRYNKIQNVEDILASHVVLTSYEKELSINTVTLLLELFHFVIVLVGNVEF